MLEFYSCKGTAQQKKRIACYRVICWCAAIAGSSGCIALCARVTTANASSMQAAVIGLSTAAGWLVILLVNLGIRPIRAELAHAVSILAGETEELTGTIRTRPDVIDIPHSVSIRRVVLTDENGGTSTLNVLASKASLLPEDGTRVRVHIVRRFITGIEVIP